MEHLNILALSVEQVREARKVCGKCSETADGVVPYCKRHRTDSFIFLVNRCEKLKETIHLPA